MDVSKIMQITQKEGRRSCPDVVGCVEKVDTRERKLGFHIGFWQILHSFPLPSGMMSTCHKETHDANLYSCSFKDTEESNSLKRHFALLNNEGLHKLYTSECKLSEQQRVRL